MDEDIKEHKVRKIDVAKLIKVGRDKQRELIERIKEIRAFDTKTTDISD